LRRVAFGLGLLLTACVVNHAAFAQAAPAKTWLGIAAGPPASTETMLAADIARLFPQGSTIRALPMLGDSGAGNLDLLLDAPGVNIAFVSADTLAETADKDKALAGKLDLILRLPPQELHLLARSDIATVTDLAGRQVNFGSKGSASARSAAALFKTLGVEVEALYLDAAEAVERLKRGTLSAAVILAARPSPQVAAVPGNAGLHLLPIPFGAPLEAAYLPTELDARDYPNLIEAGDAVPTVATGMVLLAAKAKKPPSPEEIDNFVASLFSRFAELQADGRHPKWRDVNLAAGLPGFKRNRGAEAWLAEHAKARPGPVTASAAGPSLSATSISGQEREALFKQFIEWRRAKER
jgi:TRAP transporter TAXI family solute receptor